MQETFNTDNEFKFFSSSVSLGKPQSFRNMTIVPVMSATVNDNCYTLLQKALESKQVRILEVSEGGQVPNLKVVSEMEDDVLILEGEELIGAKQNRIVNTSIIVGARKEITIPVSCVEHGRWRYTRRDFTTGSSHLYSALRRKKTKAVTKNLSAKRSFSVNQGEIWDDIQAKQCNFSVRSETGAMQDVSHDKQREIQEYGAAFKSYPEHIGFIVLIDGKVSGCDIFGYGGILQKVYKRILKGYILDALESYLLKKTALNLQDSETSAFRAEAFLNAVCSKKRQNYPSIGEGIDIRIDGKDVNGFALVHKEHIVHMAAFAEVSK